MMADSPNLTLTYLFSTIFKFASRFVAESYQLPANYNNYFSIHEYFITVHLRAARACVALQILVWR